MTAVASGQRGTVPLPSSLLACKLDESTTTAMLHYITSYQFSEGNRLQVTIQMKNKVKKAFGQHQYSTYDENNQKEVDYVEGSEEDPAMHVDGQGTALLQQSLVKLVMTSEEKRISDNFLEMIALMGKRFVQRDWPNLMPELS